jgi:hypothetical protein
MVKVKQKLKWNFLPPVLYNKEKKMEELVIYPAKMKEM